MSTVSSGDVNQGENDSGTGKRLLEVEDAVLPETKRTKTESKEDAGIGSDKGPHVSGPAGSSEATRKLQGGKQKEKNKGRRRGTRPQVEDNANRPKTPRLPKKQCAVLIGFSGTNYAGMQM